ncbi:substrate-binding domain-containing protein [Alkalilacustris brevis]|uniref:substrate-binding domain-containing protein n=1 Tax=Alkalilacustris brevis TaxID=2026338 RepID=UPI000E0D57C5|nr:substrate-binding domain-containing protein [Alkalilacustris brevis]
MRLRTLALVLLAACAAPAASAETVMRMAVTTSFANSGLAEALLPRFREETGITVQLLIVGSGQALTMGAAGDVDVILSHDPQAEAAWLAEGYGTERREIMYNDFVIVGPRDDPADVAGASTASQAIVRIAEAGALFVSRGDESGTHVAERRLWHAAGIEPSGAWYRAIGQGMGAALNTAAAMEAYTLSDRGTWLAFENRRGLALLFSGDPALFNQYALLPVNPERHPHVRAEAVARLAEWLTSQTAQTLIDGFHRDGVQLFHFNAHVAQ